MLRHLGATPGKNGPFWAPGVSPVCRVVQTKNIVDVSLICAFKRHKMTSLVCVIVFRGGVRHVGSVTRGCGTVWGSGGEQTCGESGARNLIFFAVLGLHSVLLCCKKGKILCGVTWGRTG